MTRPQASLSVNGPILAAQYVRMSTEHQQYSINNQSDANSAYAKAHNMEIVRTYTDAGKSGLTIENRPGLRQMIQDVERGGPGFSAILVYDVSRWGRFQDVDESAFYEYRCRRANIAVHYCTEPFSNDGSPSAALLKTIKRTMAAEYSRELSAKVFAGQAKLTELGFRQGGTAGYGLRRLLIDENGKPKFVLQRGQRKSIATDRIILIPGPPEEIKVVNDIFRMFALERRSTVKITRMLNKRGIPCEEGRPWTRCIVRRMVTNPKYIGANVSNRLSAKLRGRRVNNPADMWIRRDNAFEGIVDPELFQKAVEMAASWQRRYTNDEELLERLRIFLRKNGSLTQRLMKGDWDMPCSQVYDARFGGLSEAYKLIGFNPRRNLAHIERDRPLLPIRRAFTAEVIAEFARLGAIAKHEHQTKLVVVNERLKFRVSVSRCQTLKRLRSWKLFLTCPQKHHGNIVARMKPGNETILDYFFVRWSAKSPGQITVREKDFGELGAHHFKDLTFLSDLLAGAGQLSESSER